MFLLYFLLLIMDSTLTQQTKKIDNSVNTTTTPISTNFLSSSTKHFKENSARAKNLSDKLAPLRTEELTPTTEAPETPTTEAPETPTTEAPCEMPEINLEKITSTTISFNWNNPAENYSVNILNLGPNYQFPSDSDCVRNYENVTKQSVSTNSYNFTEAMPYYNYTIQVTAICSGKTSDSASIDVTTETSKPDPPTNFRLIHNDNTSTYTFVWNAPCNINGETLEKFTIEFNGSYTENGEFTNFTTVSVDATNDFNYTKSITTESIIKPSYNYTVTLKVYGSDSEDEASSADLSFTSDPELPGAPILTEVSSLSNAGIKIKWTEPEEKRGKILNYITTIKADGPKYDYNNNSGCRPVENLTRSIIVDGLKRDYEFKETLPYSQYTVSVTAITSAGEGSPSNSTNATTAPGKSEKVQIQEYQEDLNESKAVISLKRPCDSKGPLVGYIVNYTGIRTGYENHEFEAPIPITDKYTFELKPDYDYIFYVKTNTSQQSDPSKKEFHSSPGFPEIKNIDAPETNETSQAYFNLSKDSFDETNGIIKYYAIVLMKEKTNMTKTKDYYDEPWPVIDDDHECDKYQITPNFWNPFENGSTQITWVIGRNKKLDVGHTYQVYVRVLTSRTWINSEPISFTTLQLRGSNIGLAVGLTIGILAILGVGGYIAYFIKYKKKEIEQIKARESIQTPVPITCKRLMDNYDIMQQYETLRTQFISIGVRSKELNIEATSAVLPENKRKNRYMNVLPFDETRVKLKIEEDDDLGSDYINASYVKGYSGKVEYIATQGPLQSTCKDFWKMVVQENVTIIAMVSQFVEQNKEKCFQYFPNNGQTESYADNLQVRCVSELHFGTFCVRTLQVSKDNAEYNVTHMQFLEWPDFGVPDGTNCMLEFCCQIRERAKSEGGLVVVHCSAGVGRTGTLIATDILLQTIQDHRDINVFKTVLELRKQRMSMVQTEKQYIFIHSCLKDALEDPISPITVNLDEPLYQNMEDVGYFSKSSITDNEKTTNVVEQESAF